MPELLDLREGAKELRLSIYTLRAWIFQRRIPFVRLGRRVMLRRTDVEKLINDGLVLPKED
jgi:excisionase family DNA binding protein